MRLALLAAIVPLVLTGGCSTSSKAGFTELGAPDAAEDITTDAPAGDADDASDLPDAAAIPDSTCTIPTAATGATSSRCTPDGPGGWACDDASAAGWLYSCQESTAGAHPGVVGACSSFGAYAYADASYVVALCASAACTRAAQYDGYCSTGTAVACPGFDAAAPASGCSPSYVGQWSSGQGEPGPLYCCP